MNVLELTDALSKGLPRIPAVDVPGRDHRPPPPFEPTVKVSHSEGDERNRVVHIACDIFQLKPVWWPET